MPGSSRLTEYTDRRVWDLGGHEVTYLHIDYRFAFDCWWCEDGEDTNLHVTIEQPFVLRTSDAEQQCIPERVATLCVALDILHKPVVTLAAYRDGRLLVTFVDGMELLVGKSWQYESWDAIGSGELADLALLCSPHQGPPWTE
jgi:hypothetical protein